MADIPVSSWGYERESRLEVLCLIATVREHIDHRETEQGQLLAIVRGSP
jgi:hypothetical protein